MLGIILGAAYLLWLYQRAMFGPVTNPANEHLPDLNAREYFTLVPLVLLAFYIGLYPMPMMHYLDKPVQRIVQASESGLLQKPGTAAAPADMPSMQAKTMPMHDASWHSPAGLGHAAGNRGARSYAGGLLKEAVSENVSSVSICETP